MNNNIIKISVLALALLISRNVLAAQMKEMIPDGEAEVFISMDDLTRIKVIEDRIRSLKINQGEVEILEESQLGEIYLRPAKSNLAPINIFVITEKNHTYKLLMLPKKIPSEQILIKHIWHVEKQNPEAVEPLKQELAALIRTMKENREPEGFEKNTVETEIQIKSNTYNQIAKYCNGKLIGQHLEFKNITATPLLLNHEFLDFDENKPVLAILIDQDDLQPGDKTSIFIVREEANV